MESAEEAKKELSNCESREKSNDKLKDDGKLLNEKELDSVAGGSVQPAIPRHKQGVTFY